MAISKKTLTSKTPSAKTPKATAKTPKVTPAEGITTAMKRY